MVTETAQYSALHCFLNFKQNNEYLLISNTLRFIYSILLALAFYFILHQSRHTFAVFALNNGVDVHKVSRLLAHSSVMVTEKVYAKFLPETLQKEVETKLNFDFTPDYNIAAD